MSNAVVRDDSSLVAMDIGGANIKVAHSSGQAMVIPFEVWKRPDELGQAIATAVAAMPQSDRAVVTMTAELCDCYPTKAIGVGAVLDAAVEGLGGRSIVVWGCDGEIHSVAEIRRNPHLAAASNWLALATLAARLVPVTRGILIDIGTTTADLIPLDSGQVRREGAPIQNASRPASSFTQAFGEHRSARWQRSCRCEGLPPDWLPRSSRRRLISTWCSVISRRSRATVRRPTVGPQPLRQHGTAWPGWSAPTVTAFPLWTRSRSLKPPMKA